MCGALIGAPELQQTVPCELEECEGEDSVEVEVKRLMYFSVRRKEHL